jgi:hypothetical protein
MREVILPKGIYGAILRTELFSNWAMVIDNGRAAW